jgi:hypothetical protein
MEPPSYAVTCKICGHKDFRSLQGETEPCANCGEKQFHAVIEFVDDRLELRDEVEAEVVNRQGELVAERLQRGDGNMEASLATDRGQPTILSASRKERVDGFEEEGQTAESLAKAYNAQKGTSYTVRPKSEEDNDYVDRYLDSKIDEPQELGVQITHLDTDVIARLGKKGEFDVKRTAADLIDSINKAITAKAAVDPNLKPKTILLLQLPVMLGKLVRQVIQLSAFDLKGFSGVWIAPFRDECFEVSGPPQKVKP